MRKCLQCNKSLLDETKSHKRMIKEYGKSNFVNYAITKHSFCCNECRDKYRKEVLIKANTKLREYAELEVKENEEVRTNISSDK